MTLRLHVALPLAQLQAGSEFALPAGAARHAQVRRMQPGDPLCLFDGSGIDRRAEVLSMGRSDVRVRLFDAQAVATELPFQALLALGMPANERMDMLVEKATELGVATIQPLLTERSVLRLEGERAQRKREHWQGVAIAACEQCGRSRVPQIAPIANLREWLPQAGPGLRVVLSLAPDAAPPGPARGPIISLSGPEGGLSPPEEDLARQHGFLATALGPRILRADTAPLALLAYLGLSNAA